MKLFLCFLSTLLFTLSVQSQDTLSIKLAKTVDTNSVQSIKLYKFNPDNSCNQSKGVSIVFNNKLSSCFDFVKNIAPGKVKSIVSLVTSAKSYGGEDVACFTTNYSLLLLNSNNVVTGYIDISFDCNKLISNPIISERISKSNAGLRKVGFSKTSRENLIKLLGVEVVK